MSTLNEKDYIKILKFYNIRIPKSKRTMKYKAEQILAEKLCRCIKKIGTEPSSIGVCTKAVINNKGLKRGNFTCRKKNNKGQNKNHRITLQKR